MAQNNLVEINYYWGDDSFHDTVRGIPYTGNIAAMVSEHKDKKASLAYAICYIDDEYYCTVEVL